MLNGYIDSFDKVLHLLKFAKANKVEQVTIRPVYIPVDSDKNLKVKKYCERLLMDNVLVKEIHHDIKSLSTKILDLPHGGVVYDFDGQNLCFANCLTESTDPEDMRQFIYFPDGHLRYSWQYPGAILF